jgi:biopolymer transport protein ExbD
MSKPHINVTPLIDVLLVLLIIFMVISPLKPDSFKAKVPAESRDDARTDPETLIVVVGQDAALRLNNEVGLGTTDDSELLIARLKNVFARRAANVARATGVVDDPGRPFSDNVQRTVFIKAPRRLDYGRVARVVDAVKIAGAYPIALQIDHLE